MYNYKLPKSNSGAQLLLAKYTDHGKAFPDTHRCFRLAVGISMMFAIVCGSLGLKKKQLKQHMLGFAAYGFQRCCFFEETSFWN